MSEQIVKERRTMRDMCPTCYRDSYANCEW